MVGIGILFGEDKLLGTKGFVRIGRGCAEWFCKNLIGENKVNEVLFSGSIF